MSVLKRAYTDSADGGLRASVLELDGRHSRGTVGAIDSETFVDMPEGKPGLVGYARVSRPEQVLEPQLDLLREADCGRVYMDQAISGATVKRPGLEAMLKYLRPGDVLVTVKLDRLARSLRDLLDVTKDLERRGIDLRVLQQPVDTTTPAGKLLFAVLGAVAEFERDLVMDRTRDGLAAARARGRVGGRPRALAPEQIAEAKLMYSRRKSISQIARVLGTSRATVYRALSEMQAWG